MSEVINGVPRELLERLLDSDGIDGVFDAGKNYAAHQELRALLSEQPQSSVSCVACEGRPSGDNVPCAVCGQPQASAAQSAPDEREAAVEAAYAAVVEGGWSSVKEMGVEMFQAGAAWQRAQSAPVVPDGLAADLYEIAGQILSVAHAKHKAVSHTLMAPIRDYTLKDAQSVARITGERLMGIADRLAAAPQPDQFVEATDMVTARQEQGDEVRSLREALEKARHAVDRADYSTGICCCGSYVATRGMHDGHSPVDEGDHFKSIALKDIDAALSASAEGKA